MIRKGDWLDITDTEAKLVHGVGMKLPYPFTVHGSRFTDLRSLGQLTAAADPLGNTVSLTYDKNGNDNTTTDPEHNVTTYTYDYRGRPTQRMDALGQITAFSYTATGCQSCGGGGEKLTSLTDAAGSATSFAYDLRGLLTTITDPLQKVTSLTYDVDGRPKTRTDRNGTALTYAFTSAGNLSGITYPDSSQVTYSYDNLDRLTQMHDTLGTSSFTYDAAGRITTFTDPDGFTFSYVYDAAGNITQITYPDATTVTYAYDAANRLTTVTDWLGGQAAYTYDQDGRLASFTQFNGIATTYTYDGASRLTGIANNLSSFQFTLDANGNRTGSNETQPLSPTASNGVSAVYTYNTPKDRLLSAGPLSYTYDNEGQLLSSGGTSLTFDYNHRLVEIGSDTQFSYDGRGNRLSATRAGVTTRYIYDPSSHLSSNTYEECHSSAGSAVQRLTPRSAAGTPHGGPGATFSPKPTAQTTSFTNMFTEKGFSPLPPLPRATATISTAPAAPLRSPMRAGPQSTAMPTTRSGRC